MIRNARLPAFLLLAGLLASGCSAGETGAEANTPAASTPATGTPAAGTPGDDSGDLSEADVDLMAKVTAGVPPTDLSWSLRLPKDWIELKTDPGEFQWRIPNTRCLVTAYQPAGLGTDASPNAPKIVSDYIGKFGRTFGETATVGAISEVKIGASVAGTGATLTVRASTAPYSVGTLARGEAYAYRSGDFALVLVTTCAPDEFPKVDSTVLQPFLADGVRITFTY